MPLALVIIGLLMLVVGIRGTQSQFTKLIVGDFTGNNNFIFWMLAIIIVGMIGYVEKLKSISNAFLLLIIVVIFLSHAGFFAQFEAAIKSTTAKSGTASGTTGTGSSGTSAASSAGSSNTGSTSSLLNNVLGSGSNSSSSAPDASSPSVNSTDTFTEEA
jgi:hypothetical protein